MSNSFIDKKSTFIIKILYITILIALFYLTLRYALPLILPFIIAMIISYIAEPYVNLIVAKLHIKRSIASVIVLSVIVLFAGIIITLISVTIISGIKQIVGILPEISSDIDGLLNRILNNNTINNISFLQAAFEKIKEIDLTVLLSGSIGSFTLNSVSGLVTSMPKLLLGVLITIIATVFFSISFNDVKTFIITQFREDRRKIIFETKSIVFSTLKAYIKTYASLMLITFSELTVLFIIFDIRPAASIALIVSAVDILPVLGVGTILIPWALIKLIMGYTSDFAILLSIYVLVTVLRQIIEPKIIGNNTGLHPLLALISIYVGLKLFGVIGIFLMPISLTLVIELQKKGYLKLWK